MDKYRQANQNLWNAKTEYHVHSAYYDLEGFKAGAESLYPVELEELAPEVAGKTLLHLQCHFGQDTLSWARHGAIPTGVDFSDKAITQARALNDELGLDCTFVQSDIFDLPDNLSGQFDIVFTSYGVLAWLSDLTRWAEVIAHFLKPGGAFYIAEIHPVSSMFYDGPDAAELVAHYPYFHKPGPIKFKPEGSYAVPDANLQGHAQYEWFHSLGEIISALTGVGLHIQYLHEFDHSTFQQFPFLEKRGRLYYLPDGMPKVPLLFSIKAQKA